VQDIYLDALEVLDHMEVHYGHFLNKERRCGSCGRRWPQPEEKKTDVLIACHLHICDSKVRRSQLPDVVVTPAGVRLERPLEWH